MILGKPLKIVNRKMIHVICKLKVHTFPRNFHFKSTHLKPYSKPPGLQSFNTKEVYDYGSAAQEIHRQANKGIH